VGSVHDFNDFPVNISGIYTFFIPYVLKGLGCALEIQQFTVCFSPFIHGRLCNFKGYFINITVLFYAIHFNFCGNIKMGGNGH